MTRKQILQEALSPVEQKWLDDPDNESKIKRMIANDVRSKSDVENGNFGDNETLQKAYELANALLSEIFKVGDHAIHPNKLSRDTDLNSYNSKISKAVREAVVDTILNFTTDPATMQTIRKDLVTADADKKLAIYDNATKDSVDCLRLSGLGISKETKDFLLALYDTKTGTIGKGELTFAMVINGARILDHTSKSNKADLEAPNEKGELVPVEIKSDKGVLAGSGAKHTYITAKEFKDLMPKILSDIEEDKFKGSKRKLKDVATMVGDYISGMDDATFRKSPFSQTGLREFWKPLIAAVSNPDQVGGLEITDDEKTEFFSELLFRVYWEIIYSKEKPEALEKGIRDLCKDFYLAMRDDKDIRTLLAYDTKIRARVYMHSTSTADILNNGYLIFCKRLPSDIIAYVIDYSNNEAAIDARWNKLIVNNKLNPQSRNGIQRGSEVSIAVHEQLEEQESSNTQTERTAETTGHFVPIADLDVDDNTFAVTLPKESSKAGWSVLYSFHGSKTRGEWWSGAALVDDYSECGLGEINPLWDAKDAMHWLTLAGFNVTFENLKGIKTEGYCTEDVSFVFEITTGEYFVAYHNYNTDEFTEGVFFGTQEEAYEFAVSLEVSEEFVEKPKVEKPRKANLNKESLNVYLERIAEDASCGDYDVIGSNDHEVFVVQDWTRYSEDQIEEFQDISWYDYIDNMEVGDDDEYDDEYDEDYPRYKVSLRSPTEAEIEKYFSDFDPNTSVFNVFVFEEL